VGPVAAQASSRDADHRNHPYVNGADMQTLTHQLRKINPSTRHFIRHYVEMLVAMILGMAVFALPADATLLALGTSSGEFYEDAPARMLLGMALAMTVPMVAWMRYRGHAWQPSMEMAASMFIPTFGVVALLASGLVEDSATLLAIEHAVMLPAMLIAMLLRRDEYTSAHGHSLHESVA
jgi:hypothetical protein